MTLSMAEFQAFGKRPVLSPEETVAAEAYYQQRSQFHGMSGLGGLGACCSSCEKPGGMSGFSGPVFPGRGRGMGAVPATVLWGAGDRDAQDLRSPGAGFVSSVDPGAVNASLARPRDVSLERRVALTRMIEELEALTGTPGVSSEVLAQRVWTARLALLSAGNWSWADYADPRDAHDAKIDLERRLLVVERLLGVGKLAPALGALALRGRLSGLGAGGGAWGQAYNDPVEKLASCIRGALCMPKAFCCPSRRQPAASASAPFRPVEIASSNMVDEDEILEGGGIEERQRLIDDTWLPPPGELPTDTAFPPPPSGPSDAQVYSDPWAEAKVVRAGVAARGGADAELWERTRDLAAAAAARATAEAGSAARKARADAALEALAVEGKKKREAQARRDAQAAPPAAPAPAVAAGQPLVQPVPGYVDPLAQFRNKIATGAGFTPVSQVPGSSASDPFYAQKLLRQQNAQRSGVTSPTTGQVLRAGHSLGALPLASAPAVNMLRMKLRQARNEIARRRA